MYDVNIFGTLSSENELLGCTLPEKPTHLLELPTIAKTDPRGIILHEKDGFVKLKS